jgi:hypothetical protein
MQRSVSQTRLQEAEDLRRDNANLRALLENTREGAAQEA